MFGERLKLARRRSGLSLRALSSRIGGAVSAQAIGKYERGEMMPSSGVAIDLAEALDVSLSHLLSPSSISLESIEFRKLASTSARERAAVDGEVLDCVDRYLQIEEILGISSDAWEGPDGFPYSIGEIEDAERAALALRSAWDLGGDPISDLTEVAEEHGIKVIEMDLPGSVDGLSCRVRRAGGGRVPVVVCSTGTTLERQRFTIAHELGHILLDVSPTVQEEKACHRFAGAFLAPGDALLRQVGRRRHSFGSCELVEIKHVFGISAAALVMRMRDLGIIGESALRAVFGGIGRDWRRSEPRPLARAGGPGRFVRLCLRALAEGEISASKAAELLRLRVSEIERMMAGSAALEFSGNRATAPGLAVERPGRG